MMMEGQSPESNDLYVNSPHQQLQQHQQQAQLQHQQPFVRNSQFYKSSNIYTATPQENTYYNTPVVNAASGGSVGGGGNWRKSFMRKSERAT